MSDVNRIARLGGRNREPARVLVIEDDDALRALLTDCLELAGYRAHASRNGLDGWQALDQERPDLLVVDLEMPVLSGFRLLRLLSRDPDPEGSRIPVVVVTGHDMWEVTEMVREDRPDAYLQKPFAPERLLQTVDFLIRRDRCT